MSELQQYLDWQKNRLSEAIEYYNKMDSEGVLSKERHFFIERSVTVGGSDIGTLCGVNKYSTPMQLFAQKTMRVPPYAGNFQTRLGTSLEYFIYSELPYAVSGAVLQGPEYRIDPEHPWRTAQIDNTAYIPQWDTIVNIECKKATPSIQWGKGSVLTDAGQIAVNGEDDLVPKSYYLQCIWGQMVGLAKDPNAPKITLLLAFMPLESKIRIYVIRYDEEIAKTLAETADSFVFNNLMKDEPPAPTDAEISDYMRDKPSSSTKDKIIWADAIECAQALKDVNEELDALKERKQALQDELTAKIGSGDALWSDEKTLIATWKSSVTNRFDTTSFKKDHPDLYKDYCKSTEGRRFVLKL